MSPRDPSLEHFIRALHRRQLALWVAERAGVGLAGGCGVALVLVSVLLWRGLDVWGIVTSALTFGALAGAAWGFARRPTPLATAAEADRQLGTADLLGTAWAVRPDNGSDTSADAWRRTVVALAAERVRGLSPSAVLLHRFGLRAWGGIALFVALILTLGSLSPETGSAATTRLPLTDSRREVKTDAPRPIVDLSDTDSRRQRRIDRNPGEKDDLTDDGTESSTVPLEPTNDSATAEGSDEPTNPAGSAGAGDGSGRTDPETASVPPVPSAQNGPRAPDRPITNARNAGGSGRTATDVSTSGGTGGGTVSADEGDAAPPWQHPAWPAAAEAAGAAVRAGRVPDAYRDLVRDYFDRPAGAPSSGTK